MESRRMDPSIRTSGLVWALRATGRYCPVCGAEGMTLWLGGYLGTLYHCPKCGYVGPVVIERDLSPPEESRTSHEAKGETENES